MAEETQPSTAQARQSGTPSTSAPQTLREEVQQDRAEVCDKLIKVFQAKSPDEWRKLIAVSKQWPLLCDRCGTWPCCSCKASSTSAQSLEISQVQAPVDLTQALAVCLPLSSLPSRRCLSATGVSCRLEFFLYESVPKTTNLLTYTLPYPRSTMLITSS